MAQELEPEPEASMGTAADLEAGGSIGDTGGVGSMGDTGGVGNGRTPAECTAEASDVEAQAKLGLPLRSSHEELSADPLADAQGALADALAELGKITKPDYTNWDASRASRVCFLLPCEDTSALGTSIVLLA
eukprot:SAG11_NODE_2002_length_3938_cov_2.562126_2_plen_132_part_00